MNHSILSKVRIVSRNLKNHLRRTLLLINVCFLFNSLFPSPLPLHFLHFKCFDSNRFCKRVYLYSFILRREKLNKTKKNIFNIKFNGRLRI